MKTRIVLAATVCVLGFFGSAASARLVNIDIDGRSSNGESIPGAMTGAAGVGAAGDQWNSYLVDCVVGAAGQSLRTMRDPTRGGLAATLNEIAHQSGVGIRIVESAIPVRPEVAAACELLGLDPLHVANEGKLVAIVAADGAEAMLAAMRAHPQGAQAAIIGKVVEDEHHFVQMTTAFGGDRIVDWLSGEQLPRIC